MTTKEEITLAFLKQKLAIEKMVLSLMEPGPMKKEMTKEHKITRELYSRAKEGKK